MGETGCWTFLCREENFLLALVESPLTQNHSDLSTAQDDGVADSQHGCWFTWGLLQAEAEYFGVLLSQDRKKLKKI